MAFQKKFLAFAAAPVAIAAVLGGAAFTAGNDTVVMGGAALENVDYLYPATGTSASPVTSFAAASGNITAKYGHLPEWFQIADGTSAVPSSIQEAGDIMYIDTFSSNSTDDGNVISGLAVRGNIVNLPEVNNSYAACMLPVKIYNSADSGTTWTDITDVTMGVDPGAPYYVDCNTGQIDFTLRGDANLDEQFVVTVEQGGSIVPHDAASPAVQPLWSFQSTPLTSL